MSFWKKDTKAEVTEDISVGSAADVEAVMKKYDRESNTRLWEGTPKLVIRVLMAMFSPVSYTHLAAMLWFVEIGQMPAWALLIVICREFAVSGLRMIASDKGRVIAAGWSGKVKTASTMVCVVLMFLPIPPVVNTICVWVITLTTLYSGVEYFVKNKDVIASA